jgi:hypothetical protein
MRFKQKNFLPLIDNLSTHMAELMTSLYEEFSDRFDYFDDYETSMKLENDRIEEEMWDRMAEEEWYYETMEKQNNNSLT